MRMTYVITSAQRGNLYLQCDGTVQRFRSLPAATFFLIGEDEHHVYRKTGPLMAQGFASSTLPHQVEVHADVAKELDIKDNPWTEPLKEIKS